MVKAEENVLDAESEIGESDFAYRRRRLDRELGSRRGQSFGLGRPSEFFDAHEYIGKRRRQAFDCDALASKAAVALDRSTLNISATGELRPWRYNLLRSLRQTDIDPEPQLLAERRDFEQQVKGVRSRLAQLQITRA